MKDERKELIMDVVGLDTDAAAARVAKTIRLLDPAAEVDADLAHQRITVRTCAQSLEVSEALSKAGYEAKGMTL